MSRRVPRGGPGPEWPGEPDDGQAYGDQGAAARRLRLRRQRARRFRPGSAAVRAVRRTGYGAPAGHGQPVLRRPGRQRVRAAGLRPAGLPARPGPGGTTTSRRRRSATRAPTPPTRGYDGQLAAPTATRGTATSAAPTVTRATATRGAQRLPAGTATRGATTATRGTATRGATTATRGTAIPGATTATQGHGDPQRLQRRSPRLPGRAHAGKHAPVRGPAAFRRPALPGAGAGAWWPGSSQGSRRGTLPPRAQGPLPPHAQVLPPPRPSAS